MIFNKSWNVIRWVFALHKVYFFVSLRFFFFFLCYDIQWIFDGTIIKLRKIELSIVCAEMWLTFTRRPINSIHKKKAKRNTIQRCRIRQFSERHSHRNCSDIWRQTDVKKIQCVFFGINRTNWFVFFFSFKTQKTLQDT